MKRVRAVARWVLSGLLFACLLVLGCATSVEETSSLPESKAVFQPEDWAGKAVLDLNSIFPKTKAKVASFIDGDTTHFLTEDENFVKIRYLAVNTPEITGEVEPWGKKAASFTKEKLSQAVSIILESDTPSWEIDSTGSRVLAWVWYQTDESLPYRNLNIELLQSGLGIASSSANNRYGPLCTAAIEQAKAMKLNIYSEEKDPDYFYGEAIELSLREIRLNLEKYEGKKVAFEGVIALCVGNTIYVQDLDPDTGLYFGIPVYLGYNLPGKALDILSLGNRVRIAGTVQYYEAGGTWQVSGLHYRMMKPDDPMNVRLIKEGEQVVSRDLDPQKFFGEAEIEGKKYPYCDLAEGTILKASGLKIKEASDLNDGALELECEIDGKFLKVLCYNAGARASDLIGKIADAKVVVSKRNGQCFLSAYGKENLVVYD